MVATPVFVPVEEKYAKAVGVDHLRVWISDPNGPVGFIDSEPDGSWAWDWLGTYVLLVEEIREIQTPHRPSGVSALCRMVNFVAGHDPCGRPEETHVWCSCSASHMRLCTPPQVHERC
jgi:hypothetical protein